MNWYLKINEWLTGNSKPVKEKQTVPEIKQPAKVITMIPKPTATVVSSLAADSLAVALTQGGKREAPGNKNTGKEVDQYLKAVGLNPGYAWCMAFVYWCVQEAATKKGIKNPLVKTGGVLRQWNETTCKKIDNKSTRIKAGDIFIMDFGKGAGHTGFVLKVSGSFAYTIEGNTNDEGSREGYKVAQRRRLISGFKGFIQLP